MNDRSDTDIPGFWRKHIRVLFQRIERGCKMDKRQDCKCIFGNLAVSEKPVKIAEFSNHLFIRLRGTHPITPSSSTEREISSSHCILLQLRQTAARSTDRSVTFTPSMFHPSSLSIKYWRHFKWTTDHQVSLNWIRFSTWYDYLKVYSFNSTSHKPCHVSSQQP